MLIDRNKRSVMLSLLLWSVNLFIPVCTLIFLKQSWKDFTSDKFDTFPSNFYQHHNFFKLSMSSRGKTMLTYKLDQGSLQRALLSV